jgi:murein L,D-transpeptidase YafK
MRQITGLVVPILLPALCAAQNGKVPASVSDVFIAETGSATLHRFRRSASGIVSVDERYISIGQNGAGKQRAWDRKTPLGVYFITERLDTRKMHAKYGVAAYPLDYPNAWDRYRKRTGDGIWLHGVDKNAVKRPPKDTDGCLALPNDDLLDLTDRLKPLKTPVIVTREMVWETPERIERTRSGLRAALESWRRSLEEKDLAAYLSLYAEKFRYREMDRDSWASYRLGAFAAREVGSVRLEDVILMADPEEPGLYLSRFTQEFVTDNGPVRITKRLYWMRGEDDFWRIIAEGSG